MRSRRGTVILMAVLLGVFGIFVPRDRVYEFEKYITKHKILWSVRKYKAVENENIRIFFTEVDKDFTPMIERAVRLYFPALKKDFDADDAVPPVIVVYPDESALNKSVGLKEENTPMGVYCGNVINILSPRHWAGEEEADIKDRFLKEGPLVHELAHYLFDIKTKGNFDLWFTEGVALYYEYKYTGTEWRADLKSSAGNITLKEMSLNFKDIEQGMAYRQSFEFVNNIVRQKGEEYLQEIILRLGRGESFEKAVSDCL